MKNVQVIQGSVLLGACTKIAKDEGMKGARVAQLLGYDLSTLESIHTLRFGTPMQCS